MKAAVTTFISLVIFAAGFSVASADLVISEFMYDLDGADTGREWVEIFNDGSEPVDLTGWKFNDGSNHVLNEPPKNGGKGSLVIGSGEYAIFAADAEVFLSEHSVSVSVIDTVINLGQQDDRTYTLQLINPDGVIMDEVSYTIALGAQGDGNSLHKSGNTWQAKSPSPGEGDLSVSGQSGEGEESQEEENDSSAVTPPSSSNEQTTSSFPVEPQIFAKVTAGSSTVAAGGIVAFQGASRGLQNKPLANARYLWNFGDGAIAEGKNVFHTFRHPGTYVVVLSIASGEHAASDRVTINVVASKLLISAVSGGESGYIEISNPSPHELDISFWILESDGSRFTMPEHSIILPKTTLRLSALTTKLTGSSARLLYPNGTLAVGEVSITPPTSLPQNAPSKPSAPASVASRASVAPSSPPAASEAPAPDEDISRGDSAGLAATPVAIAEADEGTTLALASESGGGSIYFWTFVALVATAVISLFFVGRPAVKMQEEEFHADQFEIEETD